MRQPSKFTRVIALRLCATPIEVPILLGWFKDLGLTQVEALSQAVQGLPAQIDCSRRLSGRIQMRVLDILYGALLTFNSIVALERTAIRVDFRKVELELLATQAAIPVAIQDPGKFSGLPVRRSRRRGNRAESPDVWMRVSQNEWLRYTNLAKQRGWTLSQLFRIAIDVRFPFRKAIIDGGTKPNPPRHPAARHVQQALLLVNRSLSQLRQDWSPFSNYLIHLLRELNAPGVFE